MEACLKQQPNVSHDCEDNDANILGPKQTAVIKQPEKAHGGKLMPARSLNSPKKQTEQKKNCVKALRSSLNLSSTSKHTPQCVETRLIAKVPILPDRFEPCKWQCLCPPPQIDTEWNPAKSPSSENERTFTQKHHLDPKK